MEKDYQYTGLEIAVIGMACRFPMAQNYIEFWDNLTHGREAVYFYSDEELRDLGVAEEIINDPAFVKAAISLKEKKYFDAAFFDYRPDEAQLLNPDSRIFHECVWEALEDAGCNPEETEGAIGLYAGAGDDVSWKLYSIIKNQEDIIDPFTLSQLNNKDHLSSLISYKLNLKGPAVSLSTACSTSLVAVHIACRSLLLGENKIAIAGGASIRSYKENGYIFKDGGINSKDGHCRAFDESSSGIVGSEGAGVVVLKRLKDAIADKDNIYAIIKGSAINNDGNKKVGYTAPSVDGQTNCIKMAHMFSKIEPSTISYVEAHGTATKLGDPIELAALNSAFKNSNNKCAIGSVKTNVGHLDAAAGIAGFIKTVLLLKNKTLVPSLNYNRPNSKIAFNEGPFYVNTELKEWVSNGSPLRAGVSSFGIGGTNAHVVLEEAPAETANKSGNKSHLLTLSAKSESSLLEYIDKLSDFVQNSDFDLASMAYTFQLGRKDFTFRKAFAYENKDELLTLLTLNRLGITKSKSRNPKAVFMFSGSGSQYINMGKGIYENDALFRAQMNDGFLLLQKLTGIDYKKIIFSDNDKTLINNIIHIQPIVFIFGYCLAKRLISLGIQPSYMIGHSLGEYIAACISGVFDYEDAVSLIVKRGQLLNKMPEGIMISAAITTENAFSYKSEDVSIAAVNSPNQIVFSGVNHSIEKLMREFEIEGIAYTRLFSSHALHSNTIDLISEEYRTALQNVRMSHPKIPFISNLSGQIITNEEAVSVEYWIRHMRDTVHFSKGLFCLKEINELLFFIEVGSGHSLSGLLHQQNWPDNKFESINMTRHPKFEIDDYKHFNNQLGKLWMHGFKVDWISYNNKEIRRKLSMPCYAFEKKEYPVEVDPKSMLMNIASAPASKPLKSLDKYFYQPKWEQTNLINQQRQLFTKDTIIIFTHSDKITDALSQYIKSLNGAYWLVKIGNSFLVNENEVTINPSNALHYESLFKNVLNKNDNNVRILHCWSYEADGTIANNSNENINFYRELGYDSLTEIARQLSSYVTTKNVQIDIIGNGLFKINNEQLQPAKSLVLGAAKVIPLEFDNVHTRVIDILSADTVSVEQLINELNHKSDDYEVCIRAGNRYAKEYKQLTITAPDNSFSLNKNNTYVITGASGGLAQVVSTHLVKHFNANIILLGRQDKPPAYIESLKNLGKILYLKTDINNFEELETAITYAENEIGVINGVIHTAGQADFSGVVVRRQRNNDSEIFKPKVSGTRCLISCFESRNIDFFVNCSALAASIPSFGQIGYVAANLYQDTIAQYYSEKFPIVSIQWCVLKGVGMAAGMNNSDEKNGLDAPEIMEVLFQAIKNKVPVQIISPFDLKLAMQYSWKNIKAGHIEHMVDKPVLFKERPELNSSYLHPETDIEIKITKIWESFFGIKTIGLNDNFFDLGGDSLRALVICKRMQSELNIKLSLADLFHLPTVKLIAEKVKEMENGALKNRKSIII